MASVAKNVSKLVQLAQDWGMASIDDLLSEAMFDSVSPGICMNEDCDYSTEVEPDCRDGYCEACGTQTVRSCLVLAGVI